MRVSFFRGKTVGAVELIDAIIPLISKSINWELVRDTVAALHKTDVSEVSSDEESTNSDCSYVSDHHEEIGHIRQNRRHKNIRLPESNGTKPKSKKNIISNESSSDEELEQKVEPEIKTSNKKSIKNSSNSNEIEELIYSWHEKFQSLVTVGLIGNSN